MLNEQEFTREILACERMLYRVARGILPSDADALDAVQEAILRAWKKRDTVQTTYFRAWLCRIVINECHTLNRRAKRIRPMAEVPDCIVEPEDVTLRDALERLPEKLRLPLLLHYLEGFPLADIAKMLSLPLGTVKFRLHAGRNALREALSEEVMEYEKSAQSGH